MGPSSGKYLLVNIIYIQRMELAFRYENLVHFLFYRWLVLKKKYCALNYSHRAEVKNQDIEKIVSRKAKEWVGHAVSLFWTYWQAALKCKHRLDRIIVKNDNIHQTFYSSYLSNSNVISELTHSRYKKKSNLSVIVDCTHLFGSLNCVTCRIPDLWWRLGVYLVVQLKKRE